MPLYQVDARFRYLIVMSCLAGVTLLNAQPARAIQGAVVLDSGTEETPQETAQDEATRLTLYPQPAPQPTFKYQLLPRFIDRRPGNAVVWYGKVKSEQNSFFSSNELWNELDASLEAPLDELDQFKNLDVITTDFSVFRFLEYGGQCEDCNWQLPVRDESYFLMLLPEIQESRSFGRLLAVRARIQISRHEYNEALRTITTGMALARNVSESPTLVSGLVGLAIGHMMLDQLFELMQQPDAPNVYWALASLPHPFITMRQGIAAELDAIDLLFPELRRAEGLNQGAEFWNRQYERVFTELISLTDGYNGSDRLDLFKLEGARYLFLVRGYPVAKKVLSESGLSNETIEQMPVVQAVLTAALMQYEIQRDIAFQGFLMTYPEARTHYQRTRMPGHDPLNGHPEILPLAEIMLPALDAVQTAITRQNRRIATLRIIEALRLHSAAHDGQLPASLDDVTDVPLPIDPVTEKPFEYRRDGDTAWLTGPSLPNSPLRIQIRMSER